MLRIEIKRENDDSLKIKENMTILAISATTFDIDFSSLCFWPGKFAFFRNDHFYNQKVTQFVRALRLDSWVDFLR